MSESKPVVRAWVVLRDVHSADLEEHLNKYADDGYQVFKLERHLLSGGTYAAPQAVYDVVLCNPTIMASKATAGLQAMIAGLDLSKYGAPTPP